MKHVLLLAALVFIARTGFAATGGDNAVPTVARADAEAYFRVAASLDPSKADLWSKLLTSYGEKDRYTPAEIQNPAGPKTVVVPAPVAQSDVKFYYEALRRLDPKKPDLFAVLVGRYGLKLSYTSDEIQFPLGLRKSPDVEIDYPVYAPNERSGPSPAGTFSADEVAVVLKVDAVRTMGDAKALTTALDGRVGPQSWYTAAEVRDVLGNAKKAKAELPPPRPTRKDGWQPIVDGLRHFKLRQSWTDLTLSDDPSLNDSARKKVDDLVGATVSVTGDRKANTRNQSITGALIFPIEWKGVLERDMMPERIVFAPSVSINRITDTDPTKQADEVSYRGGLFAKWAGARGWLDVVQFRSAIVYMTDTNHKAKLPGFELELEPQMSWQFSSKKANDNPFMIGFRNVLVKKEPELADQSDDSLLDYQFRIWGHLEGGDLQRVGEKWKNVTTGQFLRSGPSAQLKINAPRFIKGLSFTTTYNYLPSHNQALAHNSLLKLDATLTLSEDPVSKQKISFNAKYTEGGLDFTKTVVESTTFGLSVLF